MSRWSSSLREFEGANANKQEPRGISAASIHQHKSAMYSILRGTIKASRRAPLLSNTYNFSSPPSKQHAFFSKSYI